MRFPSTVLNCLPALALLGLAAPAAANGFSFAGELHDGAQPFNGSADFELALYDVATGGAPLWSESQSGVQVVGGVFALDVGSESPLPPSVARTLGLYLEVVVEGDALAPRARLGAVPVAERAVVAGSVDQADDALALGEQAAEELATLAALQTLGGASVAWGNLSGLPAGVDDGMDNGTAFTTGAGLVLNAGQLSLANDGVQASHLASGAVTSAKLAAGAVGTTQLADGAVQSTDVADGSVGGFDVANDAIGTAQLAGTLRVYQVQYTGCLQPFGTMMSSSSCTAGGSCPVGYSWDCLSSSCVGAFGGNCSNASVGRLPTQ
ncbi:MAG: hypothetical protein IT382_07515 [Deltaproteobacteria bacterium]|nr:hypothetical protein [Deltaproteobacteria bacterium]